MHTRNTRTFALALGSLVSVCGLIVACSDDNTTGTSAPTSPSGNGTGTGNGDGSGNGTGNGTGSGSGNGSGNGNGSNADDCTLSPGTYTMTYTKTGGSEACKDLAPSTFEVKANADGGTSTPTPSPGCEIKSDPDTCSYETNCEIKTSGYTTTSQTKTSTKDDVMKGSQTSKTVKDEDGSVLNDCSYDFEAKKK